jgi:hypothetical protein
MGALGLTVYAAIGEEVMGLCANDPLNCKRLAVSKWTADNFAFVASEIL